MKKYLLSLLLLLLICIPVKAQISIPESVLASRIGTTQSAITYDYALSSDVQPILTAVGANQTWDFSGFVVADTFEFVQTYMPATADIPGNDLPEFAGADFVIRSEEELDGASFQAYSHNTLQNGEFRSLGTTVVGGDMDGDGVDDEFHTFLDPGELLEVFPIQYEDMRSDSTATRFSTAPDLVVSIEETDSEVDGWGTLVTASGTFDALRSTTILRDINPFTFITTVTTFVEFIAADGSSASISIDENGQVFGIVFSMAGPMVGTDTERVEEGLPTTFELAQNFPNPFNPSTRIAYTLPESSDVRLTVYTLTGKVVKTLVNSLHAAGTYEASFDASHLASGVYLYRLETSGFTQTRIMNLVK